MGTLPKTNSSHLKIGHPKRKGLSSNHQMFRSYVSFRGICPMVKSRYIGDGRPPTFNRNPYNGYINPYYWVDEFISNFFNFFNLISPKDSVVPKSVSIRDFFLQPSGVHESHALKIYQLIARVKIPVSSLRQLDNINKTADVPL